MKEKHSNYLLLAATITIVAVIILALTTDIFSFTSRNLDEHDYLEECEDCEIVEEPNIEDDMLYHRNVDDMLYHRNVDDNEDTINRDDSLDESEIDIHNHNEELNRGIDNNIMAYQPNNMSNAYGIQDFAAEIDQTPITNDTNNDLNPDDLIPKDRNAWNDDSVPEVHGNFLTATSTKHYGITTRGSSSRNTSYDIRGDIETPRITVPWNSST